ncbi:hypothetical protein PISMIDRAFT_674797 [Pisolithus microcarpus 441]|uniref:Uncharacterized protein n=1 Tax=Pisolithus microcarpus 441 TaxID=765257 RepID=A0A0C9ZNE1_9AGAM|nr:hypothetical protein PISMIDRAFT_674797 [Pisolithus microcarpus 441]
MTGLLRLHSPFRSTCTPRTTSPQGSVTSQKASPHHRSSPLYTLAVTEPERTTTLSG